MRYLILALAFFVFLGMAWALDLSRLPCCRPEDETDHQNPDHT